MLLAYLGPETMLPMTSVVAGVAGFFMMFGRKAVEMAMGIFRPKAPKVAIKTRARGHRPTTSRGATPSAPDSSDISDRDVV